MISDKGPATPLSALEKAEFLHQFSEQFFYLMKWYPMRMEQNFDLYDVVWWVRLQAESMKQLNCQDFYQHVNNIQYLFSRVHSKVSRKYQLITCHSPIQISVQMVSKMSPCLPVHQNGDAQGASKARLDGPRQAALAAP
jgi:hypothetical protein